MPHTVRRQCGQCLSGGAADGCEGRRRHFQVRTLEGAVHTDTRRRRHAEAGLTEAAVTAHRRQRRRSRCAVSVKPDIEGTTKLD